VFVDHAARVNLMATKSVISEDVINVVCGAENSPMLSREDSKVVANLG
jgi:hypothetical protein